MSNQNKYQVEETEVRDMRDGYTWFNNGVIDDYAYLLGTDPLSVYMIYCRRAMNNTQSTRLAQSVIAAHLHVSKSTVSESLVLLEWLELVRVLRRHRSISRIYLKKVRPLTPERIQRIRERCQKSRKYAKLQLLLLTRLDSFQSLGDRIDDFVAQSYKTKIKIVVATEQTEMPLDDPPPTNGHQPPQTTPDPLADKWAEVLRRAEAHMPQAVFDNWLRHTKLIAIEKDEWTVACDSETQIQWLEGRLLSVLEKCVPRGVKLRFEEKEKAVCHDTASSDG